MSDAQRLIPGSRYRVVYKLGNFTAIDYADDRAEAVAHAKKVDGFVEEYTKSDRWQVIEKGDEVSECLKKLNG